MWVSYLTTKSAWKVDWNGITLISLTPARVSILWIAVCLYVGRGVKKVLVGRENLGGEVDNLPCVVR